MLLLGRSSWACVLTEVDRLAFDFWRRAFIDEESLVRLEDLLFTLDDASHFGTPSKRDVCLGFMLAAARHAFVETLRIARVVFIDNCAYRLLPDLVRRCIVCVFVVCSLNILIESVCGLTHTGDPLAVFGGDSG